MAAVASEHPSYSHVDSRSERMWEGTKIKEYERMFETEYPNMETFDVGIAGLCEMKERLY